MNSADFILHLKDVDFIINVIELICIILCTYYIYIKIINKKLLNRLNKIQILISTPLISIFSVIIRNKIDIYYSVLFLITIMAYVNNVVFKENMIHSFLITVISYIFSYILYILAVMIAFFPSIIIKSNNDYIGIIMIIIIYGLLIYSVHKIKRIKYGLTFLQDKLENTYYSILILNIGTMTLFSIIALKEHDFLKLRNSGFLCIILVISMFLTIKQSFDLYYKQNLLVKDLEETKEELEEKKQEIAKLEKENLEFSKMSHSLAHKQKALEFKLEQLMKIDIDAESKETIKEEIEKVSKEVYKEPNEVKLAKTEIESIDNMFSYMQSECIKNNIKFELQVVGNIYYMINNLICENDLEILIADHIKDAIIAINYSDNLNRSILVRIGKIDNIYSLYIYDSGIEFTKEVLDNLGKKPITTHADTGGTGMGFMNTFDTINKTKASLIINEIGKPCEDNYTKALIFKFDNQNEFKVNSYKNEVVI